MSIDWRAHVRSLAEAAAGTWDGNSGPWHNAAKLVELPTWSAAKAA